MHKRSILAASALSLAAVVTQTASAAVTVASDPITDYALYSGPNGQNGGTGFTPWVVTSTGPASNGGAFINNTPSDVANNNAYTGISGQLVDLFENGNGTLNSGVTTALRGFAVPLTVGGTFSFTSALHYASGLDTSGNPTSSLGFSLKNALGATVLTLAVGGGTSGYALTDLHRTGEVESNVYYNYQTGSNFAFTLTDALGDYSLTVTGGGQPGPVTLTGQVDITGGTPTAAAFFNNDGGYSSDLDFNNLSITAVPEPTSLAALFVMIVPMARRHRR